MCYVGSVAALSLVALPHVKSSMIGDQTHVPYFGRLVLNEWTSREVPLCIFNAIKYMSSLYILGINPLKDIRFANIFYHSEASFTFYCLYPLLCRRF